MIQQNFKQMAKPIDTQHCSFTYFILKFDIFKVKFTLAKIKKV